MNVLALDLSLTSTGWASWHGGLFDNGLLKPPSSMRGMKRLAWIRDQVLEHAADISAGIVAIEGYSFGSKNNRETMGELGGVVRLALYEAGVPYVDIQPSSLKRYAAGSGNAKKELVLVEAVKRLKYSGSSNDVADALWLLHMTLDHYGVGAAVKVPQAHREALEKVAWPAKPAERKVA